MRFAQPEALWLLLVLPPALVLFFWWAERQRERLMTQFIQARLLPGLTVGLSRGARRLRSAGFVLAAVFLILALARPQWGFTWEEAHMRGLDIAVAVDVSKSMLAEDVPPNRLARAKLAVMDLVRQARADRLALVAFAGTAFLQCPLTFDDAAFMQTLQALDVNTIPQGGTAIAEAIETALTAFKEGDNHKVLVLLTDGEDLGGGAVDAAGKAAEAGLRIYTIGIGTPEGDLLRIKTGPNSTDYVRDEQGNVVKSHLKEDLLQEIAGKTEGGFYLPLRGAKTMETLYEQALSKLPKTERQERLTKRYHERFQWPLGIAILLLMAEMFVEAHTRKSEVRSPKSEAGNLGRSSSAARAAVAGTILILLSGIDAQGSSARALKEYEHGNYGRSLADYEQLLTKNPDDPRLHYNAGVAAYRNGDYQTAARHFDKALNSPDLNLQGSAYYNRGNSSFYHGEQEADPAKRKEIWRKALQDFLSSLKLNAQDADAKHNADYVKQRLEELQQQQQQQQQNKDQQEQDQEQQQKKSQQPQEKDQQQQKQQQQQQSKPEERQDQGQQNQQQQQQQQQREQEQSAQDQKQQQAQADEKKQEQSPAPGEQDKERQQQGAAAGQQQMSQEEAKRLLDAQKENEKLLPSGLNNKGATQKRPFKDW